MTTEMIKDIADSMIIKMRIVNRAIRSGEYANNIRELPMYSEWRGMCHMLKIMGIAYEVEYNDTVTEMTAIIINGEKFIV